MSTNNLPANLRRHTAWKDAAYSHTVNLPEDFVMPSVITNQVRKGNVIRKGINAVCEIIGQSFKFTYSPDTMSRMQGEWDQYFFFDDEVFLGGAIEGTIGYREPNNFETDVVIRDGQVTTIEIQGLTALSALTARSEAAADASEAALNEFFDALPIRVATYAAMVALLVLNHPREFTVLADEEQGVDKVPYKWDGVELFVYGTLVDPQPTL